MHNTSHRARTPVNRSQEAQDTVTHHHTQSVHTGQQEPGGPGHRTHNTAQRACTPVNRSQAAKDTAHATPHTGHARW